MSNLPDIQNSCPDIKVKLNRVGIEDFRLPITILEKENGYQKTVASINCYVDLDCNNRGVNMSRLPLVLHEYNEKIFNMNLLAEIAKTIRENCEAEESQVIYKFPYFIKKKAPVTGYEGYVFYDVTFDMTSNKTGQTFKFQVKTYATSLCPCSKEISEDGAHNQKCLIQIDVVPKKDSWIWIEDIIKVAESSASCEIFSVLKRPDEKYVTENAYNNAAFVEDITRNVYEKLTNIEGIDTFNIVVISDESIHLHKAYARLHV